MPACLFCKRDDVPRVPLFPLSANALVAHVGPLGGPCHEGAAQEVHSQMLGDYPHDELLSDDSSWLIDDQPASEAVCAKTLETVGTWSAITAQPTDPAEELDRRFNDELLEQPGELPDVEPRAPAPRPARKPRRRKEVP